MHVGHLRSTIIGDTLCNISEFFGNKVIRVNHLGDFGLPFGMMIEYIIKNNIIISEETSLQNIYIASKKEFEADDNFKKQAYLRTTELQQNNNNDSVLYLPLQGRGNNTHSL